MFPLMNCVSFITHCHTCEHVTHVYSHSRMGKEVLNMSLSLKIEFVFKMQQNSVKKGVILKVGYFFLDIITYICNLLIFFIIQHIHIPV